MDLLRSYLPDWMISIQIEWHSVALVAVVVVLLINAYFVATEFALVAARRSQLRIWVKEGKRGAAAALRAIERLDDSIAATQLGITVASLGLGWVGVNTKVISAKRPKHVAN